uniref:Putative conserved protein with signal anchor n=1 Tax=Hyalomma excavatum TaxID=257692 RepID=A0A131XJ01_9ACAR
MITSIARLAADPWSRRQQPVRVPKVSWFNRHPRFTVIVLSVGGISLTFSRVIYDAVNSIFEPESDEPKLDFSLLLRQTVFRKDGERPRSIQEALEEQEKIREEQRREKERQAELALRI